MPEEQTEKTDSRTGGFEKKKNPFLERADLGSDLPKNTDPTGNLPVQNQAPQQVVNPLMPQQGLPQQQQPLANPAIAPIQGVSQLHQDKFVKTGDPLKDTQAYATRLAQDNAQHRNELSDMRDMLQQVVQAQQNQQAQMQQQTEKRLSPEEFNEAFEKNPSEALDYKLNQFVDNIKRETKKDRHEDMIQQQNQMQLSQLFPEMLNPQSDFSRRANDALNVLGKAPNDISMQTLVLKGLHSLMNEGQQMQQAHQNGVQQGVNNEHSYRQAFMEGSNPAMPNPGSEIKGLEEFYRASGAGEKWGMSLEKYSRLVKDRMERGRHV